MSAVDGRGRADSGNVAKILQIFLKLESDLVLESEDLKVKRETLDAKQNGELVTVWMMNSWSAAESLHRKEDDLLNFRKRLYELDVHLVSLHQKVLSLQASKVQTVIKKLKGIAAKAPSLRCPVDCSIEAYKEWQHDDSKMNAIQSEVLELLSQKVRIMNDTFQHDEHPAISRTASKGQDLHSTLDFDLQQLRQRSYTIIAQEPFIDAEFSEFIQQLLNPSCLNFEAVKLREYIHKCWEDYENRINLNSSCEPDKSSDAHSSNNYQTFVGALSHYIYDKYGQYRRQRPSAESSYNTDQIYLRKENQDKYEYSQCLVNETFKYNPVVFLWPLYSPRESPDKTIIEGILFPQIADCIYGSIEEADNDGLLKGKCKELITLDQSQLGIKEQFIESSTVPYHSAIAQMKKVSIAVTPAQKLKYIIFAAQDVMNAMNTVGRSQGKMPGADEFMDIWVYVVLKSQLPNLATNVVVLKGYSNPNIMQSEAGYYLASFELAMEYIKSLTTEHLQSIPASRSKAGASVKSKEPFDNCFIILERNRCLEFLSNPDCPFELVLKDVTINGYELFAVMGCIINQFSFTAAALKKNSKSSVLVNIIKKKGNCYLEHNSCLKILYSAFLRESDIKIEETQFGYAPALIVDISDSELNLNVKGPNLLVPLPQGDFVPYRDILYSLENLYRFGCFRDCNEIDQLTGSPDMLNVFSKDGSKDGVINRLQSFPVSVESILELQKRTTITFEKSFNLPEGSATKESISRTVRAMKLMLQQRGFYSKLLPIDGNFSMHTSIAVAEFQRYHNAKRTADEVRLMESGFCDHSTFMCLSKLE